MYREESQLGLMYISTILWFFTIIGIIMQSYRRNSTNTEISTSSESQHSRSGPANSVLIQQIQKNLSFPFGTVLQMGSRGPLVTQLQTALQQFGAGTMDGIFGPQTEKAVRAFQRSNRIMIDGIAGFETLSSLSLNQNSSQTNPQGSSSALQSTNNHLVCPGENLWGIAKQYYGDGSRWREIAKANNLSNASVLSVGQKLTIPNVEQQREHNDTHSTPPTELDLPTVTSTPPEHSSTIVQSATHQVFPGENLWGIAKQYYGDGSRWEEIAKANNLSNASVLSVGQKLTIPNVEQQRERNDTQLQNPSQTVAETENSSQNDSKNVSGLRPPDPISLDGLSGLRRAMAEIYNEKGSYLKNKSTELSITSSAAAAVLQVESGGRGFSSSGKMIIRFENHIFWQEWGSANQQQFNQHFRFSSGQRWKGHAYRTDSNQPWEAFHGNQQKEWEVLELARSLSDTAALKSISMGAAQIMGFNYRTIGYNSVQEMFNAMNQSLPTQLDGMFSFIENNSRCIRGLRNNDFYSFARSYNGPGQAQTYGSLISSAEQAYRAVTQGRKMV